MRLRLRFLAALLALACGSSATRPSSLPRPSIELRQLGHLFFGSGYTAPVTIEVSVTNHANVPLRVRDIELDSPGMAQYAVQRMRRMVSRTLAPGETYAFAVSGTAVTNQSRFTPTEPLTLRGFVTFQTPDKSLFREIVTVRSAGPY